MDKLKAIVASPVYDEPGLIEPYFSHCPCDNCNTHQGNSYDFIYKESLQGEIMDATVCEECFIKLCS